MARISINAYKITALGMKKAYEIGETELGQILSFLYDGTPQTMDTIEAAFLSPHPNKESDTHDFHLMIISKLTSLIAEAVSSRYIVHLP